ncbi:NnrU family protein [Rhizobium sp. 18065]|uniref:NnrU family protein n=1 Tax=Rhizobium sp. 18065 TaxID=2681411 RepID=UPI0013592237|nr:NnrU family protein [Rhizobium sp. 18065]
MNELILSLLVFLLLHSVPAIPMLRSNLISLIGSRTYLAAYSAVSVAVMVWVVHAALRSDFVELWDPSGWQALVTIVTSPLALFLVLAGLISPNHFSISLRAGHAPVAGYDTASDAPPGAHAGAIVAITRHPVLWGFILWSLGHLLVNGDLRSLTLFGGLGIFSVVGLFILDRRARRRPDLDWHLVQAQTSIIPLAALIEGRTMLRLDGPMLTAFVLTCGATIWLLTGGHALLFGADPIAALAY